MALETCLLFQSGSKCLSVNTERFWPLREKVVESHRLKNFGNYGMVWATSSRGSFRNSSLRRRSEFSIRSLVSLERSSSNCKRRIKEGRLIAHQTHRYGFATSAMTSSRDSDDEAQMPRGGLTNAATSSTYPCMYIKSTVSSGETIRYSGTVVVLGDVHEGGAIMADGDIVVLGRLQGDVHGGRKGDRGTVVYATQLDACQIRIAEATASVSRSRFDDCPAIVSVQENGTLHIRAAVQKANDHKEASKSSEMHSAAVQKANDHKEASKSSEMHSAAVREALETSKGPESMDQKASKRPAKLALYTGVYISLVGMALLVFPSSVFGVLFDVRSVTVGWIRVGAILAVVFGVYYIGTAIGDMMGESGARAFYMSTIVGRVFLFFGFCWLVAVGAAQRALFLVGVINMLGAMSMLIALRQAPKATVLHT